MRVLSIAPEVFPLIKTGGLADVAGALPTALAKEGVETRTLLPGYPQVMAKLKQREIVHEYNALFGGDARILAAEAQGLDLFVLDAPHLYDRFGNPYVGPNGLDWPDNAQRFAALARVGANIGRGFATNFQPDVVHAHDWQSALVAAYLHYDGGPRPGTVLTVHNLLFQGRFPATPLGQLGLPPRAFALDGVEYFGGIGFLKAGLQFADRITTVSPTYAREIMTPEFGMGLDGLIESRAAVVEGIRNGIDEEVWNPAADPGLAAQYSVSKPEGRGANRVALRKRLGLEEDAGAPLFGVVSRLTAQKGLDLLLEALPRLIDSGGELALLGDGEKSLVDGFRHEAERRPGRVGCFFGYDEGLAHLTQAGIDFLIVPSRFEPCGLTQLCALRYGAIPIVARVGGLADTIVDANDAALAAGVATGVQFYPPEVGELAHALNRALAIHRNPATFSRIRLNGMRADVSWRGPAKRYAKIYEDLTHERDA
ncbi:MAG: glycogen synthase GlgA [Roseiarcus sp.]